MQVPPKNARRCAARATFSLRRVQPIQAIISARSTCMINSPLIRTSRFTGATKRFLRRDYVWRKKASAARLLEEDSKWESAAAIYDKLAAAGGSRSEEAKARLTNLRLEHFLWTD